MSPMVAYLIAVGVGILVAIIAVEWCEASETLRRAREDDLGEWEQLDQARDVTGRIDVGGSRRW